jgi:hypothetical protein
VFEREGEGWRLAWDPQRDPFPLLIGGDGWATELTAAEGQGLFRAISLLHRQHRQLGDTLMEEEAIDLDFTGPIPAPHNGEGGELWVALEGDRHTWALRFVLQPAKGLRGLEGSWARGAATELAEACAALAEGGGLALGSSGDETRASTSHDQQI